MPRTNVALYRDDDGRTPIVGWLDQLPVKVHDKCLAYLGRLGQLGHEMRRPMADYLRDGIYAVSYTHLDVYKRQRFMGVCDFRS